MKSKALAFLILASILMLAACSPFVITSSSSSGEQPAPDVEIVPVTGYQPVDVDQVQVEVGVGSPIPVQVTVTGSLPDSCAQIELVQQSQAGSRFQISLSTIPSSAEGCVQDSLPFRMVMPLNIVNLPAGPYSVEVNGSSADFAVETGNTAASLPAADTAIRKDDIQVDSVNVEVGVGSPIPVHAIVSLNLPNTCAQLGEIRLHREETTFYVRLIADIAERADCKADSLPFRLEVPLNIVNLPEGPYEVNVNGATTSFAPRPGPASSSDLSDFETRLQRALIERDAAAMRALMGESFTLAYWQSEGQSLAADEAVTQLLDQHVGQSNNITFHTFQNIPGFDPQAFVAPNAELARAIFATGWGTGGTGEALLFVARRPDASLFWQGVLLTPQGFAPPVGQACTDPVEVPVVNGRANYNGISFAIDASLNYGLAARICPATGSAELQMVYEPHPPYTQFFFPTFSRQNVDFQPEIRVYEVTGDLQSYLFPINELDALRATLEQRPEPVTWFKHSPLHTRQAYLDFAGGAGVRGLVQYMQDFFFFSNNGLTYEFHGLSQDGRHFVSVRYPVSVPFLMEIEGFSLPPVNLNPDAMAVEWPGEYEQQRAVIEAYNAEAIRRFEQMSDAEAFPSLVLLDRLVQSIAVSQP